MEGINLLYLGIVVLSWFLPSMLLLSFCIPWLMMLSWGGYIPPLLSIGSAEIQIFDLVLVMLWIRYLVFIFLHKVRIKTHYVHFVVIMFLMILLLMTMVSFFRFGQEVFIDEVIAFARFIPQISILFLVSWIVKTPGYAYKMGQYLEWFGFSLALGVYLNMFGIKVGEVQITERTVRYFGFAGDQLGFILPLFIFNSLLERSPLRLLYYSVALLATVTRGPLLTIAVGIAVLAWKAKERWGVRKRLGGWRVGTAVLLGLIGLWLVADIGGIAKRFTGLELELGLTQRLLTSKIALEVFLDNLLTGVGYTGFRYAAFEYGAFNIFEERIGFSPNFIATAGSQWLQVATDGGLLALLYFAWMIVALLQTLRVAADHMEEHGRTIYLSGYAWLVALVLGNWTAAWMLPGSLISYLLWLICGSAVAIELTIVQKLSLGKGLGYQAKIQYAEKA